jgi:hypothetical protein
MILENQNSMTQGKVNFSIKHIAFLLLFIVAVGYVLFQARFVIFGPQVEISYPKHGSLVAASMLSVEGKATNISWISLNDRQIFTDEKGFWSEKLMLPPGVSIITVKTRDRFGREIERSVQVMAN